MLPLEYRSNNFSRLLKSITAEDDWDTICKKHLLYSISLTDEYEKECLTKADEIIVVFPDWHLHSRKESLMDNFVVCDKWAPERTRYFGKKIKKRKKGCSLERPLSKLLSNILKHKEAYPGLKIDVIQAGDLYELWETNWINRYTTAYKTAKSQGDRDKLLDEGRDSILKLLKQSKIWGVKPNSPPPYNAFKKFGCENPYRLRYSIEQNYLKLFGLFNDHRTKLRGWGVEIPFHFIQGNHDNLLYWRAPEYLARKKPQGIWARKTPSGKGIIHVEHGHFADPLNFKNWLYGYDVTSLNVMAEVLGRGAWAKSKTPPISEMRISNYFPYSSYVAAWYRRRKKKNLAVFCMAHTHQPYLTVRS